MAPLISLPQGWIPFIMRQSTTEARELLEIFLGWEGGRVSGAAFSPPVSWLHTVVVGRAGDKIEGEPPKKRPSLGGS